MDTEGTANAAVKCIAVGSDHAGFALKEKIKAHLGRLGYDCVDVGTHTSDSCDYPDYARALAEGVSRGDYPRGILFCGSGVGVSIVANKVRNVRAALCHDIESAVLSRQHNDANVLCLGARVTDPDLPPRIIEAWLAAEFEGGRHKRRVDKIEKMRKGEV